MDAIFQPSRAAIVAVLAALALTWAAPLAQAQVGTDAGRPIRFGDPAAHRWTEDFFPGSEHDPSIPSLDELLGAPAGSRMAHSAEIRAAFETWAELSPRMRLVGHGRTHEGRPLYHAIIARPDRLEQLDGILGDLGRLADPRGLTDAEASGLIERLPAVAWMAYSIHGDETSGADAAGALAWHLIAGTGPDVTGLLDELIVIVDPNQNPDGRERFISQVEQMAGYVSNLDHASMQRGRWPFGRGNHFLFDMNRDWIAGVALETRGRWEAIRKYSPQLVVDGHEMEALDTFLTYPQAAAHHPQLPGTLLAWQGRLADDLAGVFDSFGWGYYTREWADAWGPFYTDAWASLSGAVGILYEQARNGGAPVRRASGEVVPYREAVHGQVAASMANLNTVAAARVELLTDYLAARRQACAPEADARAFVLAPNAAHPERRAALLAVLDGQGIEHETVGALELENASDRFGAHSDSIEVPPGSTIVRLGQPQGRLVSAYLEFDTRMPADYIQKERADLERQGYGNIYDVTAWDLGHAFDLECWWADAPARDLAAFEPAPIVDRSSDDPSVFAWAVDGSSDAAPRFAAAAMARGIHVHLSDRGFTARGLAFARGSLLVRRHENELGDLGQQVNAAARASGAALVALTTGRSPDEGPDLGGGHFTLLQRPRVGLLSNEPFASDQFGHLWHHLDVRLGLDYSILDAQSFGSYDLRRFNVLILPPGYGVGGLLADHAEDLAAWVEGGGTLIACGPSAADLADEELGLSDVRRHSDVLSEIPVYRAQAEHALAAGTIEVDVEALFAGTGPVAGDELLTEADGDDEALARRDDWMQRFEPYGVFLRAAVDQHHWLTAGTGEVMPVFFEGSHALVNSGDTPVRLVAGPGLRLAGLLWPEAADRLQLSAYATVEGRGAGQVILFASNPTFRGSMRGTARLFSNAVVYGPGAGASAPVPR
ncbi:M14 family zinc carboxypeptidase [Engelhardtia mirabilis]|uniref:Zinc carboxypeptidase n=1 Tax=Engelhardtia mirabilis TaxID=2528011 RepID=A0A518BRF7_9BACT|nr:Zinc carboxypeptidase [Planctomycetes bacterium Pla133]QDV03891.1 Zinc carboxypeptidase [Planctomycetes bacterium Pla86]